MKWKTEYTPRHAITYTKHGESEDSSWTATICPVFGMELRVRHTDKYGAITFFAKDVGERSNCRRNANRYLRNKLGLSA